MIVLYLILAIFVLIIAAYVLIFIRPKGREPNDKALLCDYAHRGLHGNGVPENSLKAFELACNAGYGIELDVQLSADGQVMVFHDYTLMRMIGYDKKLCELDSAELSKLRLADTDQTIPEFAQVLELIDGRVPLLVELKGEDLNASVCPKVAEMLREYKGSYCIESFNPLLLKEIKKLLPNAFCGLLYTNVVRDKKKTSALNILLTLMVFNFLCKPNFIAYNELDRGTLPVKLTTRFYRTPKFVWTIKSRESFDISHSLGEYPIFEKLDKK